MFWWSQKKIHTSTGQRPSYNVVFFPLRPPGSSTLHTLQSVMTLPGITPFEELVEKRATVASLVHLIPFGRKTNKILLPFLFVTLTTSQPNCVMQDLRFDDFKRHHRRRNPSTASSSPLTKYPSRSRNCSRSRVWDLSTARSHCRNWLSAWPRGNDCCQRFHSEGWDILSNHCSQTRTRFRAMRHWLISFKMKWKWLLTVWNRRVNLISASSLNVWIFQDFLIKIENTRPQPIRARQLD